MTKTPKNGSASSTPTPGGGPGSVAAPPSVGSTKSEPAEANHDSAVGGHDNRSGTPHSLPENSTKETNEESTLNGGSASTVNNDLLCDNNPDTANNSNNAAGAQTPNTAEEMNPGSVGGAQVKHEDVKPNVSNCSTPLQNASSVLPSDTDLFDGFDSKDGGKLFLDFFHFYAF